MLNSIIQYEAKHGIQLLDRLGDGKDGFVFNFKRRAVKFSVGEEVFRRELRAYQILRQRDINEINGFQIPRLLAHDESLRVIEMTIVRPPFLLDFAAAYTFAENDRFDFPADVIEEREAHWADIFGDRWGVVQDLCRAFERDTGLVLLDLSLNNVKFAN